MRKVITRQIKDFPYKIISGFKHLEPENAISVFCDPRGGSTWLAETLNRIPRSIIINKPLHLNNTSELKNLGFSWRQYIPENENWDEAQRVIYSILKGRQLNHRICPWNSIGEVIRSDQLILKIIRGKALLPWYVRQFKFKYKPLVVVRNPFAIAASLLNHSAWNYEFRPFEIPEGPYHEFYKIHAEFLVSLQSKEEQLIALWCMVNNVILKHPENDRSWITLNYENMVLDPQKNFQFIFDRWQLKIPEGLMNRILRPSASTVGKQTIEKERLLTDWKDKLSVMQCNQVQKVLEYFDVSYYDQNIMPVIPANQVHLT